MMSGLLRIAADVVIVGIICGTVIAVVALVSDKNRRRKP